MPTNVIVTILVGIAGLIVGFGLAYLFLGRSAEVKRRELQTLRTALDQRRAEVEAAQQRIDFLQEALEEKSIRERRALETLQRALQADQEEELGETHREDKPRPM